MRNGGKILIHQLKALSCEHVFTVPGITLTNILDGLYENAKLQTITCRQESSAAIMAQAYGQLTNTVGVCIVSGMAGAINAASGVHVAQCNATPMMLIIGLPNSELLNRETQSETSLFSCYSNIAKHVTIVDSAERIPEHVGRAWSISLSGRPGPVVLGIPENIQEQRAHTENQRITKHASSSPCEEEIASLREMLSSSSRPILIVGGPGWDSETSENILSFAEAHDVPVIAAHRCQDYVDNHHSHYVGHAGLNMNPKLAQRIAEADLLIAVGTELGTKTINQDRLLRFPQPDQQLVHVLPDPDELGRLYQADLMINASSLRFSRKLKRISPLKTIQWREWRLDARKDYENFLVPYDTPGDVKLEYITRVINEVAPENAIITYGEGAYADWLHRYYQFRDHKSQLAPQCDTAEYALPSAIASKLAQPNRTVIAITGDGGFMMNAGEMATAMHYGLRVIVIIINNRMYGSSRLLQETKYPGRVLATSLSNPDFVKFAESFGAIGERVEHRKTFRTIFKRALKAKTSTIIDLPMDENALSAAQSLLDLRS